MQDKFSLFHTPIELAHMLWQRHIRPGDVVVDATCGNGYDAEFLTTLPMSRLFLFDLQEAAIEATKARLQNAAIPLHFFTCCHSCLQEHVTERPSLIVYNLGYLPGSDKTVKTVSPTTLESIRVAMELVLPKGAISITCYPGHEEGLEEEKALKHLSETLDARLWCVSWHHFSNRKSSPSLLLLQKSGH